jgi:hypothetical protein
LPPADDLIDEDIGFPTDEINIDFLLMEEKIIVNKSCVIDLIRLLTKNKCTYINCSGSFNFECAKAGTATVIKWCCTLGHEGGQWSSQPRFYGMYAGNLQLAAAILLTGNNYKKMALCFSFMNMGFISEKTFFDIQKMYVLPAIEKYWASRQIELLTELARRNTSIILAGDARMDSPGHNAQFCTYSFVDVDSNAVIHAEFVDCRETGLNSYNMEKVAFCRGMDFLREKIKIAEVVTDQSVSISCVMSMLLVIFCLCIRLIGYGY